MVKSVWRRRPLSAPPRIIYQCLIQLDSEETVTGHRGLCNLGKVGLRRPEIADKSQLRAGSCGFQPSDLVAKYGLTDILCGQRGQQRLEIADRIAPAHVLGCVVAG